MECPVCFEVFQVPLLLPGCGHTICQRCAELLITSNNYLRCPECRLTYQLRRGICSLPKNVALLRTIEEHQKSAVNGKGVMCETHPEDAASLYCKTCEKLICLKCYFSNTLRKGESVHSGHQVNTSEDIFSKEKRLLSEVYQLAETKKQEVIENLKNLEKSEKYLQSTLEAKLKEIEKNKKDVMASIKHTAGKLKYTLNGTVANEADQVAKHLECARHKLVTVENAISHSVNVLRRSSSESPDIKPLKEARRKLETLLSCLDKDQSNFLISIDISKFDTDILSCFHDPKRALADCSAPPMAPVFEKESFIVSSTCLLAVVKYDEAFRVKTVSVFCHESSCKSFSEKNCIKAEETNPEKGVCRIVVTGLKQGTAYRMHAVARNDCGSSPHSARIFFQTFDGLPGITDVHS